MYLLGWLHFLTLEVWPPLGDIPCIPAAQSLLELRALGVPPVWVLLFWQGDYYGWCGRRGWPLVQLVAPWSSWLPGPALCGGWWSLVGGAES